MHDFENLRSCFKLHVQTNRGELFAAIASQDVNRGRQGASTNKVATLQDGPAKRQKEISNAE